MSGTTLICSTAIDLITDVEEKALLDLIESVGLDNFDRLENLKIPEVMLSYVKQVVTCTVHTTTQAHLLRTFYHIKRLKTD